MKAAGVLVGASGKGRNTLKLRPSFAWGEAETAHFVAALDHVLGAL